MVAAMSGSAPKASADTDASSDEELYNPGKQPGDNVWEPEPKTIVELYEKLDQVSDLSTRPLMLLAIYLFKFIYYKMYNVTILILIIFLLIY